MYTDTVDEKHDEQKGESSREGRPLADLPDVVGGLVNAVIKGVERNISPYGLINMEFALLKAFLRQEEWTVTQLTEVLPADAPRVSRLVTRLVDRRILRRRRRTDDRRVVRLRLTTRGKELAEEVYGLVQDHEAKLLEGVSADERAMLQRIIARILANHAAMQQNPDR